MIIIKKKQLGLQSQTAGTIQRCKSSTAIKVFDQEIDHYLGGAVYFFLFSVNSAKITPISVNVNTPKFNASFAASYDTIVSPPF